MPVNQVMRLLSPQQTPIFLDFKQWCSEQGLLERPADLSENSCLDGINDSITILYCAPLNMKFMVAHSE